MSELQQILEELRSLREAIREQKTLGFSHGVEAWAQRIQIGEPEGYDSANNGGCAWYRWNANTRRADVIHHEFLSGRITRIWLDESREYKGKPNVKLMIRIEADCTYELVTSYDNLFSRSFLWGIYQTPLDRFKDVVNIQVRPGWDKEKQKFTGSTWCNLNQGRDYLNRGYPKDEQGDTEEEQKKYWGKIRQSAIAKFNYSAMKNPPPSFSGTAVPKNPSGVPGSVPASAPSQPLSPAAPGAPMSKSYWTPPEQRTQVAPKETQSAGKAQYLHVVATKAGFSKFGFKYYLSKQFGIASGSAKDVGPEQYNKVLADLQTALSPGFNSYGEAPGKRLKQIGATLNLKPRKVATMCKAAIAEQCGSKESWQLMDSELSAVRTKFITNWAIETLGEEERAGWMLEFLALGSHEGEGPEGDLALCYEAMDLLEKLQQRKLQKEQFAAKVAAGGIAG